MSQDTLRNTEVRQGLRHTTDAAFDLLRQPKPTEATLDAWNVEKHGVLAKRGSVNVSAGGAAGVHTLDIDIPAGAFVLDIVVFAVALWNAGTSATAIVGDTTDPNGYYAAVNLKATDLLAGETLSFDSVNDWGGKQGAYLTAAGRKGPLTTGQYYATADTITLELTNVGTAATTGETYMTVLYCVPKDVGLGTFVAS